MKQLMTLERHTNVVKTPSKKSNFRNKKILPTEYVLKNQLGNSNSGKSEIDTIFENIKKLQVSKRANLKKEESPKVSKNIVAKNFQEAIAQATAEPVSNCNLNRSSNFGSTKSLHWAKTPGTSPERKDAEIINSPSKVASDALPSINQSSTMVSSVFPSNSIAEKKKLIWEKERAELQEFGFYDPWGKSGCGAPIKDQQGNIVTDYFKRKGLTKKKQNGHLPTKTCIPHSGENTTGLSSNCVTNDEEPLQQKSTFSPQHHEMVSNMYPDAEENYNNSSNIIYHNNHSHSIPASMPTTITSTNSSQYETSTNNMAQNGAHERSHLLGMNAPIDEMRRREKEEKRRKDIEYLEDLKNQIEANKRAKEQLSENQRRLDMEEEEAFRKHNRLLEQRESQQRQHRRQSFGQIPLNSQTHHHQFIPETGANLRTPTPGKPQRGPMSAAELQQANYAAIEKARFEAERDKKVKKIRQLASWGHNISKLKADFEEKYGPLPNDIPTNFSNNNLDKNCIYNNNNSNNIYNHNDNHNHIESNGAVLGNNQENGHVGFVRPSYQDQPNLPAYHNYKSNHNDRYKHSKAAAIDQDKSIQEAYAAIEKARLEAERDKKVKRIRQLAKGQFHNISKLKADYEEKYGLLPNDIPTNFTNNNLKNKHIYNHNDNHNNIESTGSVVGNKQENGHVGFVRSSYSGQQGKQQQPQRKQQQQQYVIQQLEHSAEQQRRQHSMQQQSHQDHQSHKQQLMQSSGKKENDIDEYFNGDNSNNYSNTNYNNNNHSNNDHMHENNNFLGAARESLRKRSEYFERLVGNMHMKKQGWSSSDRQHQQQEWQPQQQLQRQKQLERHNVDRIKINSTEDDDEEEEGDGCLEDLESAENLIPLVRTANALEERTRAEDRRGVADGKQGHKKHTQPKNPLVQRSLMKQAPKTKKSMK